ncbi:MAG TPA: PEGA domain-containing protein, partial [Polyangiaceae bacterium]
MRIRSFICGLTLSLHAWAGEAPAPAAPDAETKLAEAKARYEQGVEAYAAGRFKDAVDLFLEADRMSPSAPLSFNIARAYEKLGDDSGALRWYRDYLRRSPDAPNAKAVEELVLRYEARLARKGVQQLTVMSEPTGATVAVDQKPVGVTPWTGDLAPGAHRVDLTMRGYSDATREIELASDRAQDLSVPLLVAPEPVEAPSAPPPAPVIIALGSGSKPES